MLVTVAANLVLVPALGMMGGAWATLVGILVLVAASGFALRRLRMPVGPLVLPTLAIATIGGLSLVRLSVASFALASAALVVYGVLASGVATRARARIA